LLPPLYRLRLAGAIQLGIVMETTQSWYIVKRRDGPCEILPSTQLEGEEDTTIVERWGPFDSQQEAIARRVGLIRAGKCQPT
jgi:hypothetical protein